MGVKRSGSGTAVLIRLGRLQQSLHHREADVPCVRLGHHLIGRVEMACEQPLFLAL